MMIIYHFQGVVKMKNPITKEYYLGLDIGTDSVGYAAADTEYNLKKYKGEPAWGVMTFEAAKPAQDRRAFRTARRRLDRRQERVHLLEELFAPEIAKVDPGFFIRRRESMLLRGDAQDPFTLFSDDKYTDREYSRQYPTIHHLICELMRSDTPHDVRLVFHACAWLVAHRGHFLFDIPASQAAELLNFDHVYREFTDYLAELELPLPWPSGLAADTLLSILKMKVGVKRKEDAFKKEVFSGGKLPADAEECPYSFRSVIGLLCGRKSKPKDLFRNEEYTDLDSVDLAMDDEQFAAVVAELGDDGELLQKLRAMQDCAMLISTSNGKNISESKVDEYDQHKKDLKWLKRFVKKYLKCKYNLIFRAAAADNYVAYSGNVKSCPEPKKVKKTKKDGFCDFLKKQVKDVMVDKADKTAFEDMLTRLDNRTFLPKQRDSDNRVIPQQLYRIELEAILDHAANYLPLLSERDDEGISVRDKILSVFDFKIPYFVGPLGKKGENVWLTRKAEGKIYPWNFDRMVDQDRCEDDFIRRMTNTCTYLPGEDVLPECSLLYSRFMVLNEINPIRINDVPIPVEVKQAIYSEIFMRKSRVTKKQIETFLRERALLKNGDILCGIDERANATLKPWHDFARLLSSGVMSVDDAEAIILRAAYSEDRMRFQKWLAANYPTLSKDDREYIGRLKLKGFGRLSRKLLTGVYADSKNGTGEARSIIDAMWETNENLMQLLSDRWGYGEVIGQMAKEYYDAHPRTLSKRLEEMYVSPAVRRPIIRTLDITADVVKAMGGAPKKIFVEMARGGAPEQKGRRTVSRKQQLLDLYKTMKNDDVRQLSAELEAMGETADNRLQSERLFLYYLQLGKCAYSGEAIDLAQISTGRYNVDHIYPQAYVKDDSILNNKVLVLSTMNAEKGDQLVPAPFREKMCGFWAMLQKNGLMTEEKYKRLTRKTPFTEEERMGFINRQLVETRQSTKVIAALLQERYPDSEIVYVKAGLVSEFRQEFDLVKCRAVNDLHHAKDAYLNIVVGNVYHERFSKRWFSPDQKYNVQAKKIFTAPVNCGGSIVWNGTQDLEKVKKAAGKNTVHLTRYAFCRKGGLFDQNPRKASAGLIPLKKGLPTEIYGGYRGATVSFFILAKYSSAKNKDLVIVPVELQFADKVTESRVSLHEYVKNAITRMIGMDPEAIEFPLGERVLRINTCLLADGLRLSLRGCTGVNQLSVALQSPLLLSESEQKYLKRITSFLEKQKANQNIIPDEVHDGISAEKNIELYGRLQEKLSARPFQQMPANPIKNVSAGRCMFEKLSALHQMRAITNIVTVFSASTATTDLTMIGGKEKMGNKTLSCFVSNWTKKYHDVRIIDDSPAGLFEQQSENILNLL